jgi:O-antigen ligase
LARVLENKARLQTGLSGRETIWRNTWDFLHESPFLGVGPGNFSREYVSHFGYFVTNSKDERAAQIWAVQRIGDQIVDNFHAHNIYLQLLGEVGVAGPLLFLIGAAAVLVSCERRSRMASPGSFRRAVLLATAANAVGLVVFGFFDSQLAFTLGSLNLLAGPLLAMGLTSGASHV